MPHTVRRPPATSRARPASVNAGWPMVMLASTRAPSTFTMLKELGCWSATSWSSRGASAGSIRTVSFSGGSAWIRTSTTLKPSLAAPFEGPFPVIVLPSMWSAKPPTFTSTGSCVAATGPAAGVTGCAASAGLAAAAESGAPAAAGASEREHATSEARPSTTKVRISRDVRIAGSWSAVSLRAGLSAGGGRLVRLAEGLERFDQEGPVAHRHLRHGLHEHGLEVGDLLVLGRE